MTSIMRDRFDDDNEEWNPEDGQLYPNLGREFPQRGSQDFAKLLLDHLKMAKEQQVMRNSQMAQQEQAAAILPAAARAANGLGTIQGKTPQGGGLERYFDTLQKARAAQEAQQLKSNEFNADVLKYLEGLRQKRDMAGETLASRERMVSARKDQKETDRERMLEDRRKLEDYKADIQAGLIDRRHNLESPSAVSHEDLYASFVKPGQNPPKQGMTEERRMKEPEERPSGRKLGKAQEVADKEFAQKVLAPFMYEGKYAQDLSAINDLKGAIEKLEFDKSIGAKGQGFMSDKGRSFFHTNAQDVKDMVENAVKTSLKTILGGQFTENEGQNIFRLAYNPGLPPEINIRRAKKLQELLMRQFQSKMQATKYFEKYNTLDGFKASEHLTTSGLRQDLEQAIGESQDLKGEGNKEPKPNPDLKMKGREVVKKFRNPMFPGKVKVKYSDGTEDIIDEK